MTRVKVELRLAIWSTVVWISLAAIIIICIVEQGLMQQGYVVLNIPVTFIILSTAALVYGIKEIAVNLIRLSKFKEI